MLSWTSTQQAAWAAQMRQHGQGPYTHACMHVCMGSWHRRLHGRLHLQRIGSVRGVCMGDCMGGALEAAEAQQRRLHGRLHGRRVVGSRGVCMGVCMGGCMGGALEAAGVSAWEAAWAARWRQQGPERLHGRLHGWHIRGSKGKYMESTWKGVHGRLLLAAHARPSKQRIGGSQGACTDASAAWALAQMPTGMAGRASASACQFLHGVVFERLHDHLLGQTCAGFSLREHDRRGI
eukprot:364165-Chlamydomonas_euryale.AAC.3